MDPAWIALLGTLCGGIGLKVAEHYLGRGKLKIDAATAIRDELRQGLSLERNENAALEKDRDKWRDAYYDLRDRHIALQTELTLALHKMKDRDG